MRVRAKTLGFYGGHRVRPGTEFDIEDSSKLGKWMEPVPEPPVVKKPEPAKPKAKATTAKPKPKK